MHQIIGDIRARAQSWARRERFRSCQWASFLNFYGNVGFFEGNSDSAYGGLCKSIDCHWAFRKVSPPVAQLSFNKKKKKKKKEKRTAIGQSKNPRTVSLEEKDSCGNMRQENSGEVDKRRASFTIFSRAKCMNKAGPWPGPAALDAPSLTQTLIIQSVYWIAASPVNCTEGESVRWTTDTGLEGVAGHLSSCR